jgi:hypothetical protein
VRGAEHMELEGVSHRIMIFSERRLYEDMFVDIWDTFGDGKKRRHPHPLKAKSQRVRHPIQKPVPPALITLSTRP